VTYATIIYTSVTQIASMITQNNAVVNGVVAVVKDWRLNSAVMDCTASIMMITTGSVLKHKQSAVYNLRKASSAASPTTSSRSIS
jgi:hypothetical protein